MTLVEERVDAGLGEVSSLRDAVIIAVNGVVHQVRGAGAFGTLSSFLREELRLTGTKIVCSEGDCGACSVLLGELDESGTAFEYRSIDSCIAFVYQLHRCHVITVDGLAAVKNAQSMEELHPVQRTMAECYGSQCGFCTPGFVVAITDLVAAAQRSDRALTDRDVRTGLSGNLCRCTGYVQILDAVSSVDIATVPDPDSLFDEPSIVHELSAASEDLELHHAGCVVSAPVTEQQALEARAKRPQARLIAGATDLGVRYNKGQLSSGDWLHLGKVGGRLAETKWDEERSELTVGAAVRWSQLKDWTDRLIPQFSAILERFGGPQIRNMGTVGGNVMNASPIADSLPFLMVADARLDLASVEGEREVEIGNFFLGYKTFDLEPTELLRSLRFSVPRMSAGERVLLLKASRRRDLDISTFTAAMWCRVEREQLSDVRIAYGGVGPTVLRLPNTEAALNGRAIERGAFERAGELAREEIAPISDVRGDASYRTLLASNVVLRFFEELDAEGGAA